MNTAEFNRNRNQFPPEALEKYVGRYVAWNPEGSAVIAAADDLESLCAAVDASPYDPAECVLEPILDADTILLGGGFQDIVLGGGFND